MSTTTKPKCPLCGKTKEAQAMADGTIFFRCCRVHYDPQDDGDYSDRNPAARIERHEREQERRRERVHRRR